MKRAGSKRIEMPRISHKKNCPTLKNYWMSFKGCLAK